MSWEPHEDAWYHPLGALRTHHVRLLQPVATCVPSMGEAMITSSRLEAPAQAVDWELS